MGSEASHTLQLAMFAVLAGAAVFGAVKVVSSRLITHAALYLALVLGSVAGLFIMLNAEFLAMVQIIVYVGAVVALFVFAVMLSELRELNAPPEAERGLGREVRAAVRSPYWGLLPIGLALALMALVVNSFRQAATLDALPGIAPEAYGAKEIGLSLFTKYFVPFEIASLLLLVTLVGAIVLARGEGARE